MEKFSVILYLSLYWATVCVSGQQSGSLPNDDPKKSEDPTKFSIGLGVLSPSYSQRFGDDGKTYLTFIIIQTSHYCKFMLLTKNRSNAGVLVLIRFIKKCLYLEKNTEYSSFIFFCKTKV